MQCLLQTIDFRDPYFRSINWRATAAAGGHPPTAGQQQRGESKMQRYLRGLKNETAGLLSLFSWTSDLHRDRCCTPSALVSNTAAAAAPAAAPAAAGDTPCCVCLWIAVSAALLLSPRGCIFSTSIPPIPGLSAVRHPRCRHSSAPPGSPRPACIQQ